LKTIFAKDAGNTDMKKVVAPKLGKKLINKTEEDLLQTEKIKGQNTIKKIAFLKESTPMLNS
jgi:hypothetical protein